MLFLDGVYVGEAASSARFRWVKAPTSDELTQLTHTIAHRLARYLERQGLLERDGEHSYLVLENSDEDSMDQLRAEFSCFTHVATRNGFDTVSVWSENGHRRENRQPTRIFTVVRRLLQKIPG